MKEKNNESHLEVDELQVCDQRAQQAAVVELLS